MVKKSSGSDVKSCNRKYCKTLYDYKVFASGKVSRMMLGIYSLVLLLVVSALAGLSGYIDGAVGLGNVMIVMFFGLPVVFLGVYGLFYVFLRAFEDNKVSFWESFLVAGFITLLFTVIGNVLNIIGKYWFNVVVANVIIFLLFALIVYYFVVFIMVFKNYFKSSGFKVSVSMILMFMILFVISMLQYLSVLISNLR